MNCAFAVTAAILIRISALPRRLVVSLILFQLAHLSYAQTESVQVLSSSFTEEQIAVYHAFLADYRRGDDARTINVAEQTDILEPDDGDYGGCMKKFPKSPRGKIIHHLTEGFARENRLLVVDPQSHKISDPEEGWMLKGQSVETAVKAGFESGLLTLSEIIFDAKHRSAALHYSFVCGKLCAHFETVVYEKRHGAWKAHGCHADTESAKRTRDRNDASEYSPPDIVSPPGWRNIAITLIDPRVTLCPSPSRVVGDNA